MQLGTLHSIQRFPTKSLAGEWLDTGTVTSSGLEGDRGRALIVATEGNARAGKPHRGKENDRLHLTADLAEAEALANQRGLAVELAESPERFFDLAPISIILDRWLDGLSDHVGYRVEYERFRPNFFINTASATVPEETALVGGELHLGEVVLHVRQPIERCVVTTYHPRGEASDPRILRYVAQSRANIMGIYCDVLRTGAVRVGDRLTLIEAGH